MTARRSWSPQGTRTGRAFLGNPHDPRQHPGTRLPGIDHAGVAGGYGAAGTWVKQASEAGAAVKEALNAGGVHVIAVPVAEVRP